jgi:hypothetical protein
MPSIGRKLSEYMFGAIHYSSRLEIPLASDHSVWAETRVQGKERRIYLKVGVSDNWTDLSPVQARQLALDLIEAAKVAEGKIVEPAA